MKFKFIIIFFSVFCYGQTISLNEDFNYDFLRDSQLNNNLKINNSFNIRPINYDDKLYENSLKYKGLKSYSNNLFSKKKIEFKILPLYYNF